MDFKIEFPIKAPDFHLHFDDKFFFAGSCFAENMSSKMKHLMMNQEFLYHGILFNPISLCNAIQEIINENNPEENSILEHNGIFLSWNHHGLVFKPSKSELIQDIILKNAIQKHSIKNANCLVLSFGTAFVYELIEQNRVVANCHKVPSKAFRKRLLQVSEIYEAWFNCIDEIRNLNPEIKIILTVSPVKYLKDGVHENNLSKATLLLAVNELCRLKNCYYFPAFEILQDELRDYRFYANDMAHPGEQAINYIWDKFVTTCFDSNSLANIDEINRYLQMKNHRILHEGSKEHQQFIQNLKAKENELRMKFPFLAWPSNEY